MKSQLKAADRSGALVALIVGPDESSSGTVVVRPLRRGDHRGWVPPAGGEQSGPQATGGEQNGQRTVPVDAVVDAVRSAGAAGGFDGTGMP
jgi:histidyl-tRNA synthetase